MIEIKKTTSPEVYKEYGFPMEPGTVVMAAAEKDDIFGAGAVTIKDGYAILENIVMKPEFQGFNMEFGMGKSLLNMVDLAGIRFVVSDCDDTRLMTALRFKQNAELPEDFTPDREYKYFLCLDGYFTAHCD